MLSVESTRNLPAYWLKNLLVTSHHTRDEHYCTECESLLVNKRVEVIADLGAWHLGWQRFTCTQCPVQSSRLVITMDRPNLEYQTHPICR